METQLTIKHLAAYLPYKLQIKATIDNSIGTLFNLSAHQYVVKSKDRDNWFNLKNGTDYRDFVYCDFYDKTSLTSPNNFKPILRPISDLTKEIEVNGVKFIPLMDLFMLIHDYHLIQCNYGDLDYSDNNVKYQIDDEWNHVISFEKEEIDLSYDKFEQRFALMKEWDVLDFNYIEMHEKIKRMAFRYLRTD